MTNSKTNVPGIVRTKAAREHLASGGCGGDICGECGGTGISYYEGSNPGAPYVADDCFVCRGSGMRG